MAARLLLLAALPALAGQCDVLGPVRRRAMAARLLLLAALPALAGWAEGEVAGPEWSGPRFVPGQRTAVTAAVGGAATLECRVLHLGDKAVSWVRARDLQILAHAGAVFTADARVAARAGRGLHALAIARLRPSDGGRYECQVNTEPKMSLLYDLTVREAGETEEGEEGAEGPEGEGPARLEAGPAVRAAAGGRASLRCALSGAPAAVRWAKGSRPLLQSERGGVSLDTERWERRVVSRLTLVGLRPGDAGDYCCRAAGREACVALTVTDPQDEAMNAMQRDESEAARGGGAARGAGGAGAGARLALGLALLAAWR